MSKEVGFSCYDDIYLKFENIDDDEFEELIEYIENNHLSYEGATDKFIDLKEVNESHRRALERKDTEIIELKMALDDAEQKMDRAIEIFEKCRETNDFSTCDLDMYEILKGEK